MAQYRRQADVEAEQAGHQAATAPVAGERDRERVAQCPGCRCAAKALRVTQPQPPQIGSALVQAAGELARLFPVREVRGHLGLDEAARRVFDGSHILRAELLCQLRERAHD